MVVNRERGRKREREREERGNSLYLQRPNESTRLTFDCSDRGTLLLKNRLENRFSRASTSTLARTKTRFFDTMTQTQVCLPLRITAMTIRFLSSMMADAAHPDITPPITILVLFVCVLSIGLTSPSCNFPFEDLTDAEDSLVSDTEDNIGTRMPATSA